MGPSGCPDHGGSLLHALALLVPAASAVEPVRIKVTDPSVREVVLECAGKKLTAPVRDGMVSFAENPGKCQVIFVSAVGTLDGPAEYECSARGCNKVDVVHRKVEAASDRVTIIVTDSSAVLLELKCPSGYRVRANVETNTAVFDGVPNEDCELYWKGGTALARANKIRAGQWYCQATGTTGVCALR